MARSWAELLGDDTRGEGEEAGPGFFSRLRDSLGKSRRALTEQIAVAAFDPEDSASWERLEEALIAADVGVPATAELVRRLEARAEPDLTAALYEEIANMLGEPARLHLDARPSVILVVGVNGTGQDDHDRQARGQARRARPHGPRRRRGHVPRGRRGAARDLGRAGRAPTSSAPSAAANPAAVAFDAIGAAESRVRDVVIVDTAGRLHTQTNLMEELSKVRRVIGNRLEGAPNETLLVIDATTGQNGLQQARLFGEAVDVTGVALTKLDGSAKGGIAVAIAHELGLPVKLIGIGEALDDLRPFDPDDFARALVGDA